MCTNIIYFEGKKLKQFRGQTKGKVLSHFCQQNPDKRHLLTLTSRKLQFNFPPPGPLDGVKSKGKCILKMDKVFYKYPEGGPADAEHSADPIRTWTKESNPNYTVSDISI